MLVLSRHEKETIIIGDNIIVEVHSIRGDTVRLAIHAPDDVPIHRREIWERIQRELEAGNATVPD